MRRLGGTIAAVLVTILAVACGGSKGAEQQVSDAGDDVEVTTTTTAGKGASGEKSAASGSAVASSEAAGSTSASGSTSGESKASTSSDEPKASSEDEDAGVSSEPMPLRAEISSACVRPGTPVTVTVRGEPDGAVGYDTTWSDGKNGFEAADRGGTANGQLDQSGTWKKTWTVGPGAPQGKAVIDVVGVDIQGRFGKAALEFHVSDALGKCA